MNMIKFMLKDWMIRGAFLEVLFLSVAAPSMKIIVMRAITPQMIALRFMVGNISVILFTILYDKFSDKIYPFYPLMLFTRIVVYTTCVVCIIQDIMTIPAYYLIDICISSMLSKTIHCCYARMKRMSYAGEDRERFDNYKTMSAAIAGMIGNTFAFFNLPPVVTWSCFGLSVLVDNLCSTIQYFKLKHENKTLTKDV